jgi:hypothetical protein
VGVARQGASVALSADGNTAIVGGITDNSNAGAAWVWTRSGGAWSQQGPKLVGTGAVGGAEQGYSVSLSADGNTAIVGGYYDNGNAGAAWVWTRSGGVWSQQGPKLVGIGAVGTANQGVSVSLSADGNTAIVGGYYDNGNAGAAWVWTRSGGVWSQQGPKLVGTGAVGIAGQGHAVSLSADGNTAIVGGPVDNSFDGAAWVWTRSGGVWSQQRPKLVGTGAVGSEQDQGWSVSLSADGNTAIVGGYADNSNAGAAWVYVDPSPAIISIRDIPNDQGGKVNLRWSASIIDNEPGDPMDAYWVWRQVPSSTALEALSAGATLLNEGAAEGTPGRRSFRITRDATQVYYWEYVASQVADGYPGYSYTAPTTADSVAGSNPYTLFMVEAKQLSTGARWPSDPDSGYSVDNRPPVAPAPFTGAYLAGATHLHWGENSEPDLAGYRVYRGSSAGFVPSPGNRIATEPDTGWTDVGPAGSYYKLSAVDIHGNESLFALLTPGSTTGVGGSVIPRELTLAAPRPNPAHGQTWLSFTLPRSGPVTLAIYDLEGRRVRTVISGPMSPGEYQLPLDLRDGAGRAIASGLYLARLETTSGTLVQRLAIVE